MIYLHVGLPKTASTTIQKFLAANSGFLARHDLAYPRLAEDRQSSYGVNPNAHNPLAVELRRGAPGVAWEQLRQFIDQSPKGRNIVLSAEALSGCNPNLLHSALGGAEVRIIFYVREFSKLIVSQYSQHTKTGTNTADFDTFLESKLDRNNFRLVDHLTRWVDAFGAENIRARLLDGRVMKRGDVRLDILDAIGIDADRTDTSDLVMTEDANTSPGWKTLEIIRDLNVSLFGKFVAHNDESVLKAAKKERRRRADSPVFDFAAFLARPAMAIGRSLGFNERGRYLSREQFEGCNEGFDAQIDDLNSMGMDVRLPHAATEEFVPREFMPSVEQIPPDEVTAFLRRLAPVGFWSLLSGQRQLSDLFKGGLGSEMADAYRDDEGDQPAAEEG